MLNPVLIHIPDQNQIYILYCQVLKGFVVEFQNEKWWDGSETKKN